MYDTEKRSLTWRGSPPGTRFSLLGAQVTASSQSAALPPGTAAAPREWLPLLCRALLSWPPSGKPSAWAGFQVLRCRVLKWRALLAGPLAGPSLVEALLQPLSRAL